MMSYELMQCVMVVLAIITGYPFGSMLRSSHDRR